MANIGNRISLVVLMGIIYIMHSIFHLNRRNLDNCNTEEAQGFVDYARRPMTTIPNPRANYSIIVVIKSRHFFGENYGYRTDSETANCLRADGTSIRCLLTNDESLDEQADAFWFHLPHAGVGSIDINMTRTLTEYKTTGKWLVGWTMESNMYYKHQADPKLRELLDIFASYELESDILLHYYSGGPKIEMPSASFQEKENAVAYMNSNCDTYNGRNEYISELMGYYNVSAYGACLHNRDPESVDKKNIFSRHKFCIAMENSNTKDYVTEKLWQAMRAGCLPIYDGAPNIIQDFLPYPKAAIVIDMKTYPARDLAELLHRLASDETSYNEYMDWRRLPVSEYLPGYRRQLTRWLAKEQPECQMCQLLADKNHQEAATFFMNLHKMNAHIRRYVLGLLITGILLEFIVGPVYRSPLRLLWFGRSTLADLLSDRQSLWLVHHRLRQIGDCEDRLSSTQAAPCRPDTCLVDNFVPWSEWKACKIRQLTNKHFPYSVTSAKIARQDISDVNASATTTAFDEFILENRKTLPWYLGSNLTAVLVEFRPLEERLSFSINNAMNNLPVEWRIQVVGGTLICNATRRLFPVEVEAGKIVLTDIGDRPMKQSQISEVLTDPAFYNKLVGNTWLFFQFDSAICSKQRHLIKHFLETKRGWWGAPWSTWTTEPKVGGNGGFSLRTKEFILYILDRFPWEGDWRNEDWYFCDMAASIYDDMPENLRPATFDEEQDFSSETLYSEAPFGVHQYWSHHSPTSPQLLKMFDNCPEMWDILPSDILNYQPEWTDFICTIEKAYPSLSQFVVERCAVY